MSKTISSIETLLALKNEWIGWYKKQNKDNTFTKPPLFQRGYTVKKNSKGKSSTKAMIDVEDCIKKKEIESGGIGLLMNERHQYICFDLDHIDNIDETSKEFQQWLALKDTYIEESPSGHGLRIIFRCIDKENLVEDKPKLIKALCGDGHLYVRTGYVTITNNHVAGDKIEDVTSHELEQWFKLKKAEVIDLPIESFKHPDISLVLKALDLCKLDQCDRVKEVYKTVTGEDYSHYDYWLKIMQACHHYAIVTNQLAEMTTAVVTWSQTDEIAYENDEDVITHWSSFSNNESSITYSTLMKFGQLLEFKWPNEIYDKHGATGKPMINSPINFEYLMNYFNIKFCRDIFNGSLYVKTSKDIIHKYFLPFGEADIYFGMAGPYNEENLNHIIWELATENKYTNVALSPIIQLLTGYVQRYSKKTNMLKLWLETPSNELSEDIIEKNTDISKSNLDYLMSCITLGPTGDKKLIKMYFDTFFSEMVMPIYNPKRILSQRSFMLVLTGPEACRKTTFFSKLFPRKLRSQFVTNSTETLGGAKSIRDFSTSLVTSALVVTDEFEIFYNKKNDSLFKTLVTSDVIDYVPIYEKTMKKEFKNAVLAGTTNKRSLPFEQDNNRRLALIDVKWIDTDAMSKINWHHFYRHYIANGKKALMNGLHPWKLSDKVIKRQYEINEQFRSHSNLEIVMREVFDFDMKTHKNIPDYDRTGIQSNDKLAKISDIIGAIRQQYPETRINPAELKHLLKRLCGKYTHTTNRKILLRYTKGNIQDGIVRQNQYTRYVMPPKLLDIF